MGTPDIRKFPDKIQYLEKEKIRIDIFLTKELLLISLRSRIKELIELGHILVNGRR